MALPNIAKMIYNKEEKTLFGRTCRSWALIFVFYVIFFLALAGFFMGMMSVFLFYCVKTDVPSLTGEHSLLKMVPGVTIRPRYGVRNSYIQLTNSNSNVNKDYLDAMAEFFKAYNNPEVTSCSNPDHMYDKSCRFDLGVLKACQNYKTALESDKIPCFYIKLNKIFGWLPSTKGQFSSRDVSVMCDGVNPLDKALLGKPQYFPFNTNGTHTAGKFAPENFPFFGQKDYQSPLVAVRFPQLKKDVLILVECILVDLAYGDSTVFKFEITVDSK